MTKQISRVIFFVRRHSDALIIAFFTLLVGVFFYQTLIFGKLPVPSDALVGLYHPYRDLYAGQYPNGVPFKNFLITDPVRQQIPWRMSVISAVKNNTLPLWSAASFSGAPLLANSQTGALYPLNVLFLLLPFEVAWTILIISQPLLAGIFLYLFLRRKNLDQASSFFGAITFAFSGFSVAWLTWGTMLSTWLWVPLSLLCIDIIFAKGIKKTIGWAVVCLLSITCSFFAGHLQIFIYGIALLGMYAFWISPPKRLAALFLPFMAICAGVLILTAFQWTRIVHFFPETTRLLQGAVWQADGFFIPLRHLVQFLAPDYFGNPATLNYWGTWNYGEMIGYIGIAGLVFAFMGLFPETAFWVLMIVAALLFSLKTPISALPYQLHIPFVSSLQPTRLLVVVDFSLSILCAYGLSAAIKGVKRKTLLGRLFLIGFLLILLWISTLVPGWFNITPDQVAVARRNLVMPTVFFSGVLAIVMILYFIVKKVTQKGKQIFITCIVLIAVVDLFRFGWKFTPFTDAAYFFPKTGIISYLQNKPKPYRIMTTDDRIFPPNVNEFYGIESISGYDPIHSLRYIEFITAMERGKPDIHLPSGPDRIIVPINIYSPLLALLNVRYIVSFDELKHVGIHEVFREGKTIVYEKIDTLPRAYLVQHVMYKNEKQDIIDELFSPDFDPREKAIVEYPISVLNFPLETHERAEISSYVEDRMIVEVSVSQPRVLVIGNTFDKRWKAAIDDIPTSIYRTNYIFMGILVPAGSHTVSLQYR